jgi:hypothetical protein
MTSICFFNVNMRLELSLNDHRRSIFVRQLSRPTFNASGLAEVCTFLEYGNVFDGIKNPEAEESHA